MAQQSAVCKPYGQTGMGLPGRRPACAQTRLTACKPSSRGERTYLRPHGPELAFPQVRLFVHQPLGHRAYFYRQAILINRLSVGVRENQPAREIQRSQSIGQRPRFSGSSGSVLQVLGHLDQLARFGQVEIYFVSGGGYVVKDLLRLAPERQKDQVLQQLARVGRERKAHIVGQTGVNA